MPAIEYDRLRDVRLKTSAYVFLVQGSLRDMRLTRDSLWAVWTDGAAMSPLSTYVPSVTTAHLASCLVMWVRLHRVKRWISCNGRDKTDVVRPCWGLMTSCLRCLAVALFAGEGLPGANGATLSATATTCTSLSRRTLWYAGPSTCTLSCIWPCS